MSLRARAIGQTRDPRSRSFYSVRSTHHLSLITVKTGPLLQAGLFSINVALSFSHLSGANEEYYEKQPDNSLIRFQARQQSCKTAHRFAAEW